MPYKLGGNKLIRKVLICMVILLLLQPAYAQEVNLGRSVESSPVFADVDNEPGNGLEIILGSSEGYISEIYSNGSIKIFSNPRIGSYTGWRLDYQYTDRLAGYSSVAVADITGDSEEEILIGGQAGGTMSSENEGFIWAYNLSKIASRPYDKQLWTYSTVKTSVYSSPSVGDIDGDGDYEVLIGSFDSTIYAFEGNGALKWSKALGGSEISTPALGDLDGSGTPEIVVGSSDGKIYVLKGDGSDFISPLQTGGLYSTSPALADLDSDGALEIISASKDGKIFAWHGNGTAVKGWPAQAGPISRVMSPSVGDLDADGDLEVVVLTGKNVLYAFHGNGTSMPGFPISHYENIGFTSPSLADLDGDGTLEIILGASFRNATLEYGKIYAWHINGSTVSGFPRSMARWIKSSPGISDIDIDGKNELVVVEDNGKVSIWEMGNKSWNNGWPTLHYNERNTRMYDAPTVAISSPVDGSIFLEGTTIPFNSIANDVDGSIADYEWTSDLDGPLGNSSNFEKTLSTGTHIISLTVIDSDGKVAKANIKISVVSNLPPTASINSPEDGSVFTNGSSITLSGSGADSDGSIVAYRWVSDKDGDLSTNSSFSISSLSLGLHSIILTVTDDKGAQGSAQVNILINDPPTASIDSPFSGSVFNPGDLISFVGSGTDSDGTIISQSWESSLNGSISSEVAFETSSLSIGSHVITFTVTDNHDASVSAHITIRVNSPPTADITSPDRGVFNPGEVVFDGIGTDVDGNIILYEWDFEGDGNFDYSSPTTALASRLYSIPRSYTAIFRVTDNDDASAVDSYEFRINAPPSANILSPADGDVYFQRNITTFEAEGSDTDGNIVSYQWTSSIDGPINSSQTFSSSDLSVGVHTISLTVTDNDGGAASDQVTINQTGYSLIWRNPSPGEEFKAGSTIPVRFAVYENGRFVADETVVVRIYDTGGTEVFTSTYNMEGLGPESSSVRIDVEGEQYITNYHIPKDAMGTYTIKVEFESNRPNTEYNNSYKVPTTISAVLKKIENAIRRALKR